jgi:FkbM family methyltransferase
MEGPTMKADLFLRTYRKDYQWLPYLFRSLDRHGRGWHTLHIVIPEGQEQDFPELPELAEHAFCEHVGFATCPVYPNDYIGQQISKLRAWELTDADVIVYLDSDLVFTRPFRPSIPRLVEVRSWDEVGDAQCWRQPTRDLLGWDPPYETMARHPFVFMRETIKDCYDHVGGESALLDYAATRGHFSEFNLLGNFALARGHYSIAAPDGQDVARQHWSWGGLTVEVRQWLALNGYAEPVPSELLDGTGGIWTLAGDTHVSRWVREAGRLDHDHNALPRILSAFSGRQRVWDVGAFIGDHTQAYAAAGHHVLAIEPRPDAYECLARNFAGQDDITCLCCAVGAREHVTMASPDEANKGARYLTQVEAGHETLLLDDLARIYGEPDAIKLDVEGWEVKALRGACAILSAHKPVLVVEVNRAALKRAGDSPEELRAILAAFGYSAVDLYTGEPWCAGDEREQFDVVAVAR